LWQRRGQSATLHGNLLSEIKIRQNVPEVKPLHQIAATVAWLTTICVAASPKTATCGNMALIGMTSAMSLKIRGASEQEPRLYRDDLCKETVPLLEGVIFKL
jgi:hypothetical protein